MPRSVFVVVTAAGKSERFGGGKKELLRLERGASASAATVLDRAISPFIRLPGLSALVVTAPPGREDEVRSAISPASRAFLEERLGRRFAVVPGGSTRRDSVRLALEAIATFAAGTDAEPQLGEAVVLVHDGARPWASETLVLSVAEAAAERGASVPVTPLVDTPKELGPDGTVTRHPSRASFGGAQTPQGFRFAPFLAAHRRAAAEGVDCTDDAELWDRYVGPVASVPGDPENRKITYREDLPDTARGESAVAARFRVGSGWDLHRLVPGRRLVVGGVVVPFELGEDGHSDGDVLLHAAIDALLGAAALGDIGAHFPPSDERWRDADSRVLARAVAALVREAGWEPGNLDCTVVLERPRLGPYRDAIRASVAECLGMPVGAVSVKAKTKEGVDAAGEGRAVEAQAIVALFPRG